MSTEFAAMSPSTGPTKSMPGRCKPGHRTVETGAFDHTPEAMDIWAAELRLRFGGQSVAVALEQSRGSLVFMLTKYDHLVVFPVHPTIWRTTGRAFGHRERRTTRRMPGSYWTSSCVHRDKLRRLNPDTPETRTLQFLVEERRKFVHEKTRCSNRLTAHLKMYFPQVLDWFDDIGCNIAADFLERWPSLEKLQRARPATIERFFIDHNSREPGAYQGAAGADSEGCSGDHGRSSIHFVERGIVAWAGLLKQVAAGDQRL